MKSEQRHSGGHTAAGEYKRVVHARWIPKAMPLDIVYVCSNCNYGVDQLTEYCPRCGARMDGKDEKP